MALTNFRFEGSTMVTLMNELLVTGSFSDVTLVCDKDNQIKCHKFLLASHSPVLRELLDITNCIIFRGTSHQLMNNLVQFLYLGEVSMPEERFIDFKSLLSDLEIDTTIGVEPNTKDSPPDMVEVESVIEMESFRGSQHKSIHSDDQEQEMDEATINNQLSLQIKKGNEDCGQEACEKSRSYNEELEELRSMIKLKVPFGENINDLSNEEQKEEEKVINHQKPSISAEEVFLSKSGTDRGLASSYRRYFYKSENNMYCCKLCDHSFGNWGSGPVDHLKSVHFGVRYTCQQCGHQSTQQSSLNSHEKTVHGPRVNCQYCGKSYSQSSLQNHIKAIHEKIKFFCKECEFKSSSQSALKSHVDFIHKGIFNYCCSQCTYKTTNNYNLKIHEKKMHGIDAFKVKMN